MEVCETNTGTNNSLNDLTQSESLTNTKSETTDLPSNFNSTSGSAASAAVAGGSNLRRRIGKFIPASALALTSEGIISYSPNIQQIQEESFSFRRNSSDNINKFQSQNEEVDSNIKSPQRMVRRTAGGTQNILQRTTTMNESSCETCKLPTLLSSSSPSSSSANNRSNHRRASSHENILGCINREKQEESDIRAHTLLHNRFMEISAKTKTDAETLKERLLKQQDRRELAEKRLYTLLHQFNSNLDVLRDPSVCTNTTRRLDHIHTLKRLIQEFVICLREYNCASEDFGAAEKNEFISKLMEHELQQTLNVMIKHSEHLRNENFRNLEQTNFLKKELEKQKEELEEQKQLLAESQKALQKANVDLGNPLSALSISAKVTADRFRGAARRAGVTTKAAKTWKLFSSGSSPNSSISGEYPEEMNMYLQESSNDGCASSSENEGENKEEDPFVDWNIDWSQGLQNITILRNKATKIRRFYWRRLYHFLNHHEFTSADARWIVAGLSFLFALLILLAIMLSIFSRWLFGFIVGSPRP